MPYTPLTLSQFDAKNFLQHHWQKKPLVIRSALPNWKNPLSTEELAGLACEFDDDEQNTIDSRLILCPDEIQQTNTASKWELEDGPFAVDRIQQLADKNWTMLVQSVDHWVPDVAELIKYFNFLPRWRIDDVMVSYASKGGSVGPHFDRYDVFLVQGAGQRRWQVGACCNAKTALQANKPLSLLQDFVPENEFILNPGDVLYLPPFYAHWGVSLDNDCMTYSVGFRTPSHAQIHDAFSQSLCESLNEDQRYTDSELAFAQHCGEITPSAIKQIQSILSTATQQPDNIAHWFGKYITESSFNIDEPQNHNNDIAFENIEMLKSELNAHHWVYKEPSSRAAYIASTATAPFKLFVNGEAYPCDDRLITSAQNVCEQFVLASKDLLVWLDHPADAQQLLQWFNYEIFYFD